jgi:hypothetical protein
MAFVFRANAAQQFIDVGFEFFVLGIFHGRRNRGANFGIDR